MCWFLTFDLSHNIWGICHISTLMTSMWRKRLRQKPCALNGHFWRLYVHVIDLWHWFLCHKDLWHLISCHEFFQMPHRNKYWYETEIANSYAIQPTTGPHTFRLQIMRLIILINIPTINMCHCFTNCHSRKKNYIYPRKWNTPSHVTSKSVFII